MGLFFLAPRVGERLLKRNSRWGLLIAWLSYGGLMLSLPYLAALAAPYLTSLLPPFVLSPPFLHDWQGSAGLLPAALAAVVGAGMSCIWFGWYLGVCFAFNGHNNEVGGAGRIEEFKEFIRFRVTEEGLTGYVIAVDDVSMIDNDIKVNGQTRKGDGADLQPKLIDVFHLKVKPAAAAPSAAKA